MDELKNLMIQTLEANGILGQLRAQIQSNQKKLASLENAEAEYKRDHESVQEAIELHNRLMGEMLLVLINEMLLVSLLQAITATPSILTSCPPCYSPLTPTSTTMRPGIPVAATSAASVSVVTIVAASPSV